MQVSRRSALGVGVGLGALATPLGSALGLGGQAWAEGHTAAGALAGGATGLSGATDTGAYISFTPAPGAFALVAGGHAVPLVVSADDFPGVVRVAGDLQADIERVTGRRPQLTKDTPPAGQREITVIGTIGRSPLIDKLVSSGRLDVSGVKGQWETSLQTVVEHPFPGIDRALVIAGSDQRGTIYGAYDVSRGIGVSPWYWWDDVTPQHRDALYVLPGRHTQGTPTVKYRGFFINDENPSLGGWGPEYFGPGKAPGYPGGFNADLYAAIFELMLRLKANYLWPAVWGRAFAEDDPKNHATATAYGVVMGTSHEAPMLRGIEEWNRHAVPAVRDADGTITTPGSDPYGGTGEWSFRHNADALKAYWRDGIQRMVDQDIEGVITLGMRGNGDTSLPDGDGIDLMTEIITTQRQIIQEVTGKDPDTYPQVWTLYKEVQHYWDAGLRAPDDVTVVLTDDNWANIRKLPDPAEKRAGGYGLYYHFDYVGVGRDYKWVDTTLLPNMWDQLNQCVSYGNHGLWIANAGDVKSYEVAVQFFLDYAWSPKRWTLDAIPEWLHSYARLNFGAEQAQAIAELLADYGQLQARRKPELLNRKITVDPAKDLATDSSAVVYDDQATPFSLTDYRELERVTEEWAALGARARQIGRRLPRSAQDAWYELVGYEVEATANLYALRQAEFTNLLYAGQGRSATNARAAAAEAGLARDQAMMDHFNTKIAGGKWKDFMTQPHIDYGDVARYGSNAPWQEPELDNWAIPDVLFPAVKRIDLPDAADMGVAIDGSADWWPGATGDAVLPAFSPYQSQPAQFVEIFNRGRAAFDYRVRTGVSWLTADRPSGRITDQRRVEFHVDWRHAPAGTTTVPITVTGPRGQHVTVKAVVENTATGHVRPAGFVEANGYVSIEAAHYTRAVGHGGISWLRIPRIGRTGDGVEPVPVTAARQTPGGPSARLEYTVTLFTTGPVTVSAYLSPRNNPLPTDGLTYAISFDDATPQTVDVIRATGSSDATMNNQWARNTSDNVNLTTTEHHITSAGTHTLKFWMVDPTVVLQKLVIDTGGLKPSYLGPPESYRA
jgi:hypothetical protein